MKLYCERTTAEQETIAKAYEWEKEAILILSTEPNPYAPAIKAMGLWEAFNEAIEMAFN